MLKIPIEIINNGILIDTFPILLFNIYSHQLSLQYLSIKKKGLLLLLLINHDANLSSK